MRIDHGAVGVRERGDRAAVLVRENRRPAVRRIDVHPHVVAPAHGGNCLQVVDRAGVRRAGRRDDGDRPNAGAAIGGNGVVERRDVHRVRVRRRHDPDRRAAESEQLDGLPRARVAFGRHVERERRARAAQAVLPHVDAALHVPRNRHRRHGRHRSAADQQAHCAAREPQQLAEPLEHLALEVNRGVVAARAARVHRGGERVGEDAHHRRRRVDPSPEARMAVAERIRLDRLSEDPQDVVGRHGIRRRRRRRHLLRERRRNRPERGTPGQRRQVIGDEIDDQTADAADLVGGPFGRHDQ